MSSKKSPIDVLARSSEPDNFLVCLYIQHHALLLMIADDNCERCNSLAPNVTCPTTIITHALRFTLLLIVALKAWMLHADARPPSDKIKTLAAAQKVTFGNSQDASDSSKPFKRTALHALTDFFASVPKPTTPCSAFDAMFTSRQRSIFNYIKLHTDLRALTGSLLLSLKVEEMPAALDSLDVFRIYGMMKLVAEHLGVYTITMLYFKLANTAHHSGVSCASLFSVLLLLMKDSPGVAVFTQLRSNVGLLRSTVHSFVDVLWRPLPNRTPKAAEHVQLHSTIRADDMRAITDRGMAVHDYFNAHFGSPCFGAADPAVHEFLGLMVVKKVLSNHIIQIEVSSPKIVVKLREEGYSVERIPHPIPLNWVHSVKRYASDDSCNRHKARLCYAQSFTRYTVDDKWSPMTKSGHRAVDACADVPSITNHGTRFIPPAPPQI
jgi:hypothetical protein